jgi:hypothetical protein
MFPPKVLIDSVFLGLGHKWHSTGKMVFVRCSQWIAGSEEHGRFSGGVVLVPTGHLSCRYRIACMDTEW